MKAIGYIRVSSDSQADNFSPQVQEELIKVQFQSMIEEGDIPNYVSLEMITDISVSGSLEFAERPAGRNLLSLDEVDYLFLSDTNRLSRQTRISDPFQIECIEKGINIIVYNCNSNLWLYYIWEISIINVWSLLFWVQQPSPCFPTASIQAHSSDIKKIVIV